VTTSESTSSEGGQDSAAERAVERQRAAEEAALDGSLMRRVSRGEHAALAELYDRHGARVYSIALSILHDVGRAEDVTQDVFVTLWTQPDRYDPAVGRFAPWFYRVARNRAIDVIRQRRREVMPEEPAVFDLMLGESGDSPPDAVVERSEAARVRAALRELPEEQRSLIELAYFGGYTQSQMAERLNIPLGTVKTRVRNGLRRLREALDE
jgi:RNA polymerase sigma-70 factor (ECF subfamily)